MLRAEAEQVKRVATIIAETAVKSEIDPVLKQLDELATRIAKLEAKEKPKGKTNAKL